MRVGPIWTGFSSSLVRSRRYLYVVRVVKLKAGSFPKILNWLEFVQSLSTSLSCWSVVRTTQGSDDVSTLRTKAFSLCLFPYFSMFISSSRGSLSSSSMVFLMFFICFIFLAWPAAFLKSVVVPFTSMEGGSDLVSSFNRSIVVCEMR